MNNMNTSSDSNGHSEKLRTLTREAWRRSGLKQGPLAAAADCSEQYLRMLLAGKIRNYSPGFLERFATAVGMTAAERARLAALVGAPQASMTAPADQDLQDFADEMELSPFASLLFDLDFTVLRANSAARQWLPSLLRDSNPNLARWVLRSPHARAQLVPWEEWAGVIWGEVFARWTESGDCPNLEAIYRDLEPVGTTLPHTDGSGLHGHQLSLYLPGRQDLTTIRIMGFKPATRPPSRIEAVTWRLQQSAKVPGPRLGERGDSAAADAPVVAGRPVGERREVDRELARGPWRAAGGGRITPRSFVPPSGVEQ